MRRRLNLNGILGGVLFREDNGGEGLGSSSSLTAVSLAAVLILSGCVSIPTVEQVKADSFRDGALTNCDARSGYRLGIKEALRIVRNDKMTDDEKEFILKGKLDVDAMKGPCRE